MIGNQVKLKIQVLWFMYIHKMKVFADESAHIAKAYLRQRWIPPKVNFRRIKFSEDKIHRSATVEWIHEQKRILVEYNR